jgi:hypothetical protein
MSNGNRRPRRGDCGCKEICSLSIPAPFNLYHKARARAIVAEAGTRTKFFF